MVYYRPMNDLLTAFVQITNMSPTFKGIATMIAGGVALLFWWWMKKKWNEPESMGFRVFFYFAVFVVLYGLYVLMFQPGWWKLPY